MQRFHQKGFIQMETIWEFVHRFWNVRILLAMLQVDLLASGASLFWPRSGRLRATKSREVDLSRLQGFHSHFAPKMGSGVTRIWGFRFHLRVLDFNGGMSWFHSDQIYWTCMCISIIEGANLFTVCESWRPQAAGKKQKLVSISSQYWERKGDLQWLFFN